jgi:hypothetical protein
VRAAKASSALSIRTRAAIGGSTDKKLLTVRVFDENTKRVAYNKQTQAVKGKNKSNCPL